MPRIDNPAANNSTWQTDLLETAKLFIGWASHPSQTWRWCRFLRTHPMFSGLSGTASRLTSKIHRPYLSGRLRCSERVDLLIRHYDFIRGPRFGTLPERAATKPATLCRFSGKSGVAYCLELSTTGSPDNDGEWVMRLLVRDICVYRVAFLFVAADGEPGIMIGGLKGMLGTSGEVGIKQVTRDLYGCQPKDLMVSLVRRIGGHAGCKCALLIGNGNKLRNTQKRVCKKSSDYDRIWQEMRATARRDGDFELPCISPRQTALDCPVGPASMRRATQPLRSMLVESILHQVAACLTQDGPTVCFTADVRQREEAGGEVPALRVLETAG